LPVKLENDYEYANHLDRMLNQYLEEVKQIPNFPKVNIDNVEENINLIKESLRCYYNAEIDKAKRNILKLLNKYENNKFIISDLNKNYAFRGLAPFKELKVSGYPYDIMNETELSFFKARIGNESFSKKDMLHIPFNKRELIKTQRFSISGVPCLYLGTTSYVCWLEMNKPRDSEFNVSSYKIPGQLKILNLVGDQMLINGQASGCNFCEKEYIEKNIELLKTMIEFFPIIYATSYSIINANRNFKSEYIISQLIIQCLEELKVDGIAYISKKVSNNLVGYAQCTNLAIPIKYKGCYTYENEISRYGELCKDIYLTNCVNFAEFQKLVHSSRHEEKYSFINTCYTDIGTSEIELAGRNVIYQECTFSRFDNYLFSLNHSVSEIYK
jgi:hypothetical protein